jgi:small-conductance mechanosensitive channel
MSWESFLVTQIAGNSIRDYIITVAVFVLLLSALRIFKGVIVAKLKKFAARTKMEFDDVFVEAVETLGWPFYILLALFISIQYLQLAHWIDRTIYYASLIIATYYFGKVSGRVIRYIAKKVHNRNHPSDDPPNSAVVSFFIVTVNIILWAIVIILILDNFGYNVTTLVAGLGIGGIAIAFALQSVLSDLFASVSIYFDKPFEVGDFIVVDNDSGHVQKIGLKSTRIKTQQGQELIVSNKMLTEQRVNNYKRMERRRVLFSVGVTYETPLAKLKKIPGMITEIIEKTPNATPSRVHFKEYGDFSLNYEIVYHVEYQGNIDTQASNSYNKEINIYMDTQQAINFGIAEAFKKEKIEFAYPTQVVYMRK